MSSDTELRFLELLLHLNKNPLISESENEIFLFLLLNLKEQQNQEDRRLPFLNIFSSSRVQTF